MITSAGVVLAATFASLAVLPLTPSVQNAVGVLLDTFPVRSLLVPALALSTGPKVWWPSRPGRGSDASGGESCATETFDRVPTRLFVPGGDFAWLS